MSARKARCRCGSGRQYKACCYASDRRADEERERIAEQARADAAGDRIDAARERRRSPLSTLLLAVAGMATMPMGRRR